MDIKIKRALLSVYNKNGLPDFAKSLEKLGIELISTGGTAEFLEKLGLKVKKISDLTGFPEILGGRVKTLHPAIHSGILADKTKKEHLEELKKFKFQPIDLVIVNLYPFEQVIKNPCSMEEAIEYIDIGGPTLARAAAKNFKSTCIVMQPEDYPLLLNEMEKGGVSEEFRKKMAQKAFMITSHYDYVISRYLNGGEEIFPNNLQLNLKRVLNLRYGENPHQKAALYKLEGEKEGLHSFYQYQGKELSFNNFLDIESALRLISNFEKNCCAIIKHNNPCGVAIGKTLEEAYIKAFDCDPLSSFGGIVAFNGKVNEALAKKLCEIFLEVIIAPSFETKALDVFSKKKNLRVISLKIPNERCGFDYKRVLGGLLVQEWEEHKEKKDQFKTVTRNKPSEREWKDLLFAWDIVKNVKSNGILFAKNLQTVAIGSGQTSRVDSVKSAVMKAKLSLEGSVCASDGFFPFPDGVEEIYKAGARAIIQPGGSIKDKEVIQTADKLGISMVFTGCRHFRH